MYWLIEGAHVLAQCARIKGLGFCCLLFVVCCLVLVVVFSCTS